MARVLCSSTSGAGHFLPMVPFIRGLLHAGHEVMVAGPPALTRSAVGTGAVFWYFDDPPQEAMSAVMARFPGLSVEETNALICGEVFARLNSTAAVPRLLDAIDEWRPDLVLRESAEFGSAVAAELRGVPQTRIAIGLGATEDFLLRHAAAIIDRLRRDYGLPGDPDARRLRTSAYWTLFPRGLEFGGPDEPAPVLRFRDPGWASGRQSGQPANGQRPFVYATFGTVAGKIAGFASVYAETYRALGELDIDVLLTVGNEVDLDEFGTPPPNVRVEPWVDQAKVLSRAAAVVCHGGGGSTLGALAAGVPLVVVPLFAGDQHVNAQRVAEVGAGLRVGRDALAIRSAVTDVLSQPRYRIKARVLADEMAGHRSAEDASDVLVGGPAPHRRQPA